MKFDAFLRSVALCAVASAQLEAAAISHRRLPALQHFGYDLDPSVVDFPLRECQGSCWRDEHCAYGLFCFYREPLDDVPGCDDDAQESAPSDTSYCVDASYLQVAATQPGRSETETQSANFGANGAEVISIQVVAGDVEGEPDQEVVIPQQMAQDASVRASLILAAVLAGTVAVVGWM